MKPAGAPLIALLQTRVFSFVDVYTFELPGGTDDNYRLRYTSGQNDLTIVPLEGGLAVTYKANQMQIAGLRSRASIGIDVDEQSVSLTPYPGVEIRSEPALEQILWGVMDGGFVRRDRFYSALPGGTPVGGLRKFYGLISTFEEITGVSASLRVKSGTVLLNQQMPRHLTQPTCLNTVYDLGCGLDKDDFDTHGFVDASPAPTTTFVPWALADAGMALGRLFFENMGNVGTWRSIKAVDPGVGLYLAYPLPVVPVAGDQIVGYQGCNRTHPRCEVINPDVATRWRGFRFVPQAEKAV